MINVPQIFWEALPANEQPFAKILENKLRQLEGLSNRFEDALELYKFASQQEGKGWKDRFERANLTNRQFPSEEQRKMLFRYANWCQIAVSDASYSIFNFIESLHRIRANRDKCPTLKAYLPKRSIEMPLEIMKSAFPNAESIRDAYAHYTDLDGHPGRYKNNVSKKGTGAPSWIPIEDGVENIMITSALRNGIATVTIHGQILSFPFNDLALNELRKTRDITYQAFQLASEETGKTLASMRLRLSNSDN